MIDFITLEPLVSFLGMDLASQKRPDQGFVGLKRPMDFAGFLSRLAPEIVDHEAYRRELSLNNHGARALSPSCILRGFDRQLLVIAGHLLEGSYDTNCPTPVGARLFSCGSIS